MFRLIKPPSPLDSSDTSCSVFLAGSIEMGAAEDWQSYVAGCLQQHDIAVLNPRRDEWNSSWEQTITNPQFREQVEWELKAQELATMIGMYFAPDSKSPITLLELGLFARSAKLVVCCPNGFWRKGNIEVVSAKYNIPMVETLDDLVLAIRSRLVD